VLVFNPFSRYDVEVESDCYQPRHSRFSAQGSLAFLDCLIRAFIGADTFACVLVRFQGIHLLAHLSRRGAEDELIALALI